MDAEESDITITLDGGESPPYRLASITVDGVDAAAIEITGSLYLLSEVLGEAVPSSLEQIFGDWDAWSERLRTGLSVGKLPSAIAGNWRWRPPVLPNKLICVGTNYRDHLREMGTPGTPTAPYCFLKPVSTGVVACGEPVSVPDAAQMVDWEAELAVIIGRRTRGTKGKSIMEAVAGYTVYNDLSARDWVKNSPPVGIDWVQMKGWDGFSPLGPYVTPAQFVPDPQALAVRTWVNGELKQNSNTREMIFGVQAILEHLAGIMTLEPGDVIATGTPAGVGFGAKPPQFLQPGDLVVVEVEGLGRLETPMVAPPRRW